MNRIFQKLDELNFLGFKIWEFSFRSLSRDYGWFFLFNIVLRHPVKMLRGLNRYRHFFKKPELNDTGDKIVANINRDKFIKKAETSPQKTLIGMGFCLRPLTSADQQHECPSERFSHDCFYRDTGKNHPACDVCAIKTMVNKVNKKGCSFNILTSALDVAKDIFVPTLKDRKYLLKKKRS